MRGRADSAHDGLDEIEEIDQIEELHEIEEIHELEDAGTLVVEETAEA